MYIRYLQFLFIIYSKIGVMNLCFHKKTLNIWDILKKSRQLKALNYFQSIPKYS